MTDDAAPDGGVDREPRDEGGTSDDLGGDRGERVPVEVGGARDRIEEGADRAVEEFDQRIVDLLSWLLDTETRARIYVFLRQHPDATSQEVADGTGLYPSTVREALVDLHEDGTVERRKRQSEGAGNNPYEYRAIPPSDLVSGAAGDIQAGLNTVCNLDRRLGGRRDNDVEPVSISIEDPADAERDESGE
jgi:predicted transcriptional regulator